MFDVKAPSVRKIDGNFEATIAELVQADQAMKGLYEITLTGQELLQVAKAMGWL